MVNISLITGKFKQWSTTTSIVYDVEKKYNDSINNASSVLLVYNININNDTKTDPKLLAQETENNRKWNGFQENFSQIAGECPKTFVISGLNFTLYAMTKLP